MTRTCFIHIGLPKTGSTSIQATLRNIRSDSVSYSSFPETVHNKYLLALFSNNAGEHLARQISQPSELENLRLESSAIFENDLGSNKDLIISSEVISFLFELEEQVKFRNTLLSHFDQIRCLAYIRPAREFFASGFQQTVKTGRNDFTPDLPKYRDRLENWLSVFGQDSTTIRYFSSATLLNGDVVDDALSFFGIELQPEWKSRQNDTLSLEALSLVYKFNNEIQHDESLPEIQRRRWNLIDYLKDFGTGKFGFSQDVINRTLEDQKDDINWIENVTGFDVVGRYPSNVQEISSHENLLAVAESCLSEVLDRHGVRSLDELSRKSKQISTATVPKGFMATAKEWLRLAPRKIGGYLATNKASNQKKGPPS